MGISVNWSHGRAHGRTGPGRQLGFQVVLFSREVIMMGGVLERGMGGVTGGDASGFPEARSGESPSRFAISFEPGGDVWV